MVDNAKQDSGYSVLMSVYWREKAEYLRIAMDSMWNQTVPTDDFILVCDGPLTPELDAVIEEMERSHSQLHVVRREKNGGLGNALNVGMSHCKNELIARMDSDDISRPNRCERQLRLFREYPAVSIVSGTVEEFSISTDTIEAKRVLPEKQAEIIAFARNRNPFNHPCVMYKKSAVEAAGGYQDFYLLEDYYLWIRMLQKGFVGCNLKEPLLWMRAGSDMYRRRAGWQYAKSQRKLFQYMRDGKMISQGTYYTNVLTRAAASLMPNFMRRSLFKRLLRK